jgi:hypothetical protein
MVFMSDIVSDIGRSGKSLTRANDGLPAEARSGVWSAFAAAFSVHRGGGRPSPGTRVKGRDLTFARLDLIGCFLRQVGEMKLINQMNERRDEHVSDAPRL